MKKTIFLRRYKEFSKTVFYTLHVEDEKNHETDNFLLKHESIDKCKEDLAIITQYITKIGNETGALERYFRPEGSALALPICVCRLRLYCIRCSDSVMILGNGGIKSAQKVKDCPELYPHFKLMNKVAKMYKRRVIDRKIILKNKSISGNLKFKL